MSYELSNYIRGTCQIHSSITYNYFLNKPIEKNERYRVKLQKVFYFCTEIELMY